MKFENIELKGLDSKCKETKIKLADLKGKNIILYFYPKDETPICTKEAGNFRDALKKLPEDTIVIGVSPDNIESHKKFFEKHNLNFSILSDTEHKLAKALKNIKEDVKDKFEEGKYELDKMKNKIQNKRIDMKLKHDEKEIRDKEKQPITMRSTFIIDKKGRLMKEMRDIDIKGHVDEVVEFVKTLK